MNELRVVSSLGITSALTLASGSGTERLTAVPEDAATANFVLTTSGGLTLDAGGVLALGSVNPSGTSTIYRADVTGNVTLDGGLLEITGLRKLGTSTASSQSQVTGNFTMSSGSLRITNASAAGESDRRFRVTGDATVTGGTIAANVAGAQAVFSGATVQLEPDSFDTANVLLSFDRSSAQAITANMVFNSLVRGTGVKTITSTLAGENLGFMQLSDGTNATTDSRTTAKLGSDLTLATGSALPAASSL